MSTKVTINNVDKEDDSELKLTEKNLDSKESVKKWLKENLNYFKIKDPTDSEMLVVLEYLKKTIINYKINKEIKKNLIEKIKKIIKRENYER